MTLGDEHRTIRMRGGWPSRLSDVMPAALDRVGPSGLIVESRVRRAWPEVVGEQIAANAWVQRLRSTTLEVATAGDVWAQELRFMTDMIRDGINRVCGAGTVTEVVVRRPRSNRR